MALRAQAHEHVQQLVGQRRGARADDLPAGAGGIGQRPQEIEDCGEPQGLANGGRASWPMMARGEGEADAGFPEAAGLLGGVAQC